MTLAADCRMCTEPKPDAVWENELWVVRPGTAPVGVPGWMTMFAKRHVAGIAYFNDAEAADFGPRMRWLLKSLEEASGALRVYIAAMGEGTPHFHCHLVPRLPQTPGGASSWDLFTLTDKVKRNEVSYDEAEIAAITERYVSLLSTGPAPA